MCPDFRFRGQELHFEYMKPCCGGVATALEKTMPCFEGGVGCPLKSAVCGSLWRRQNREAMRLGTDSRLRCFCNVGGALKKLPPGCRQKAHQIKIAQKRSFVTFL